MTTNHLADLQAREQALDPRYSFIVQAPAGSGKTGLLTQRFLRLLSLVEHPEELVAITFTRKAAAEMKNRLLEALQTATRPPSTTDDTDFAKRTWQLGQEALQQDHAKNWRLLANPGRLRILTIDAFCANLTRQLPLLSGLGGRFSIKEDAQEQYQMAARATLEEGKENNRWTPAIACLLDHLDNNLPIAESLLADMLARRDQWLRHIGGNDIHARTLLEQVLRQTISDNLVEVDQQLTAAEKTEIWELVGFASAILRPTFPAAPLAACDPLLPFPAPTPEAHSHWLGIADLLLTSAGDWRKQVDKRNGFPPASQGKSATEKARFQEMKNRATTLLQAIANRPTLLATMNQLRALPPCRYTSGQWRILEALLQLLPMAVAQLHLQFHELGQVDFSEMAMRAAMALGEPDAPTDLALKLDYQIKHLLVDEFQDTSHGQYRLLERLTAGWDGTDGRSLFLVGDPMQSIYRFREAEVGLFLQARRQGIGLIRLRPLTLTVNFRSQAGIVNWINTAFATILPARDDVTVGAVSFTPAVPFQPAMAGTAVTVHPFHDDDWQAEAEQVAQLALAQHDQLGKTAILVRSRAHLRSILPALDRAGLRYQGIDIEPLEKSMVIQDLLSLTRALTCPANSIAWLAVLRAPWCGLSLADLHALVHPESPILADHQTLWDRICTTPVQTTLSASGQLRLQRIRAVLIEAIQQRRRCNAFPGTNTLRSWIEHTWQAIGGPATLSGERALVDAHRFFELLAAEEQGGEIADLPGFAKKVSKLYAAADTESAAANLVIMTIHKAKGLEFDTVILPGLGRTSRGETKSLLAWLEQPTGLLLGPIKRSDQERDDPIHALIRCMEKRKADFETGRLLYVAATRARHRLHLLGHVTGTEARPATGSFLSLLWNDHEQSNMVRRAFAGNTLNVAAPTPPATNLSPLLRRLATGWSPPPPPLAFWMSPQQNVPMDGEPAVAFEWAGEAVRLVGVVVHRFLRTIAHEGILSWTPERVAARRLAFTAHLDRLGVPQEQLATTTMLVERALLRTVQDERGRWILDNDRHIAPASELALTGVVAGGLRRLVVDRTFIDQEGTRWIIDFKTSHHQGGDLDGFLDNEQVRYREQMVGYGTLIRELDQNRGHFPVCLGLYFPMHAGWRVWSGDESFIPKK